MISKSLFFKLMVHDWKKRIWLPILVFVSYFLVLEVPMLMHMGDLQEYPESFVHKFEVYFRDYFLYGGALLTAVFVCSTALLSAISGFAYLHSKVQLDTYHSLPVSRTQLFWSKYLSGILQFFIPFSAHVLICAGIVAVKGAFGTGTAAAVVSYIWLQLVVFALTYSVAVVAAGLTGNIIVNVLGTGVLFGYSTIVSSLVEMLFNKFYDTYYLLESRTMSVIIDGRIWCFSPLSMIIKLFSGPKATIGEIVNINRASTYNAPYLWVMLVAAVAYSLAAYFICLKRKSEAAGKPIAFGVAEPVIKTMVVIPVSLSSGFFFDAFSGNSGSDGWFVFGMAFMFVICCVLMEIIFRLDICGALMHKRQFLFNAACTALIFVVLRYDVAGYDTYVPSDRQIKSCAVSINLMEFSQNFNLYNGDYRYVRAEHYRMANMELQGNPSVMELARKLAKEQLSYRKFDYYNGIEDNPEYKAVRERESGYRYIIFGYKLLNGKAIYREYLMDIADADTLRLLSDIFNDHAYKLGAMPIFNENGRPAYDKLNCTSNFFMSEIRLTSDMRSRLIEQYKEEYLELTLDTVMNIPPLGWMDFTGEFKTGTETEGIAGGIMGYSGSVTVSSRELPVYPQFVNTVAMLKEFGFDMERTLTAEEVQSVTVTNDNKGGNYTYPAATTEMPVEEEYTDKEQIRQILDSVVNDDMLWEFYDYAQFIDRDDWYRVSINSGAEDVYSSGYYRFIKGKMPKFVRWY